MIINFRKTPDKGPTSGKFKVVASDKGVCFSIDHQSFNILTSVDEKDSKKEKLRINKWYAKQLRIAFKRLKDSK